MRRRALATCAAVVALWAVVACLDVSSPISGIASISAVILPTPSIVVHDSMRDTLGNVEPLEVFAFAPNGDTIPQSDIIVRYTVIDSTNQLHVDSITGKAAGDTMSPLAKVVGVVRPVNGKGVLQTVQVLVPVVPVPKSGVRSNDTTFVFKPGGTTSDSLNLNLVSPALSVTVYASTTGTTVQSYIVSYQIVHAPAARNGAGPTVVFYNPSGNDSTIAVTSSTGVATRQLRIRPAAIANPALAGGAATDTITVFVRVLYHGKPLPILKDSLFIIPLRAQIL